jgi:hypothetical protein
MLSYRRPAKSRTEREFIARYLDSIPGMFADKYGNRILVCAESRVMISTHTDTVHRSDGLQRVSASHAGVIKLHPRETVSNCLGADDTAGIYAAIRMIEAGVQATFVFHREEEIGGWGSTWLAENYPEWLATFDVCLALDRRGTKDIITCQYGGECASEQFAWSLGGALGMGHAPADGIFTDSANYAHLIPECSNLSIGYQNEHTRAETLDSEYLERVIERLIAVDWSVLEIARDPLLDMVEDSWGLSGKPCEDAIGKR